MFLPSDPFRQGVASELGPQTLLWQTQVIDWCMNTGLQSLDIRTVHSILQLSCSGIHNLLCQSLLTLNWSPK